MQNWIGVILKFKNQELDVTKKARNEIKIISFSLIWISR